MGAGTDCQRSVVWDHYQGPVIRDGLGSKEDLSENDSRDRKQHSGRVENETFDWNIMINMNGSAVLGASRGWINVF